MQIEHKSLKDYPIVGKKILIIGTFNPDTICNNAKFFYGRKKNYFWELLPKMFNQKTLKNDIQRQKQFLYENNIELTDLILSAEISEADLCQYGDDKLNHVIEWNTNNIIDTLKKGKTKEVYFTRKSFDKTVKNIKNEITKIENYCNDNRIKFELLPTPSRFINDNKIKEWKEKFNI